MLAEETVSAIRGLLAEGIRSHREIAQLLGVSRGSVGAIALGRRRDRPPPREEETEPCGPPTRCPECGALVYMPCVLCGLRHLPEDRRKTPRSIARADAAVEASMRLNLRPEHFARYEEVREMRRLAELAMEQASPSAGVFQSLVLKSQVLQP